MFQVLSHFERCPGFDKKRYVKKIAGGVIVEFVSGGLNNKAYKTNRGNEMCKVRGFTLHVTNSQLINFESVKCTAWYLTPQRKP